MHNQKTPVSEGWIIQIYGQDRRLLCALEPFHGWTFLAGLVLGLGIALIMGTFSPAPPTPKTVTAPSSDFTAPLALD